MRSYQISLSRPHLHRPPINLCANGHIRGPENGLLSTVVELRVASKQRRVAHHDEAYLAKVTRGSDYLQAWWVFGIINLLLFQRRSLSVALDHKQVKASRRGPQPEGEWKVFTVVAVVDLSYEARSK